MYYKLSEKGISDTQGAIIRVLAYYHMFAYPLSKRELHNWLEVIIESESEYTNELEGLKHQGIIFEIDDYYLLEESRASVSARIEGEARAKKLLGVAKFYSSFIYLFPFVKAVFVSGSLSKGTVSVDADIDYFIVTKANRLWIARTMLVAFKRIFLLGSKKHFCVNYFVDEKNLVIPDKNIFTATEVSTLIPMQGNSACQDFIEANSWIESFFPNLDNKRVNLKNDSFIKRFSRNIVEPLFFNSLAESLDKFFMKKTHERWTSLYSSSLSKVDFDIAFRTHRGTSKNHDKNYQRKVLEAIEENINRALDKMPHRTNA